MEEVKCLSCGSDDNRVGDAFCGDCGGKLVQPTPAVPPEQPQVKPVTPVSAGGQTDMAKVKCPSCGCANNLAGDVFCGDCGAKLAQPTPGIPAGQPEIKPVAPLSVGQTAPAKTEPVEIVKAKLVVRRAGRMAHEFPLDQEVMNVGRWDASSGVFPEIDVTQDDPDNVISRRHAKVFRRQGDYFIEDVGSLNGTYVNKGTRLRQGSPQKLQSGDEIIMGKTVFTFVYSDAA